MVAGSSTTFLLIALTIPSPGATIRDVLSPEWSRQQTLDSLTVAPSCGRETGSVLPMSRCENSSAPPKEPLRKIVRSHPRRGLVFLPGGNPQGAGMEVLVGAEQEPPHPFRR